MKTIDSFIKELQRIPESRRKLPLVIYTPNGMAVEPNIKMGFKDGNYLGGELENMVITWRE
jgi:hypothetical protein